MPPCLPNSRLHTIFRHKVVNDFFNTMKSIFDNFSILNIAHTFWQSIATISIVEQIFSFPHRRLPTLLPTKNKSSWLKLASLP